MFEHVGRRHYDAYFAKARDLLAEDGVFLLHTIGRSPEPGTVNPFIHKYIFPGAELPSLSELMASVERAGLVATDVEILRLHYAKTLRHWLDRFQSNRARVAELYDERFCRMWEIYLAGCELGFRHQGMVVFQVQLARRQDAVPLTRDYLYRTPVATVPDDVPAVSAPPPDSGRRAAF
jgi:cyclopropane-fatty-acyl-phospholipid synthase